MINQGWPDHPLAGAPGAEDDDDLIRFSPRMYQEAVAHTNRADDGECRDCRETIARGDVRFIDGDRLCRPCASDRKVTP